AAGTSQIEAALERGEAELDLLYQVPASAADAVRGLAQVLDDADEYCRAGQELLTLAAPADVVAFRHWFLGEFMRQIRGEGPTPWPDYAREHGVLVDQADRRKTERARDDLDLVTTVSTVAAAVVGELELQRVLQAVTDAATSLSGAEFGAFFYNAVDEGGKSYVLYVLSGVPREAFEKFPTPRNTAIFAPTFEGGPVVRIADVVQDERYGQNEPYHGMPPGHLAVRSYLAVSVRGRSGLVLGGLFFGHSKPGVFTERSEQLVVAIAAQAAIAIENSRLFAAEKAARAGAEEAAERLERLQAITARLSQASSLDEVAEVVVSTAAAGVGADGGMLATGSPDGTHLHVLAALGYERDLVQQFTDMPLEWSTPATDAMRTGAMVTWCSPEDRDARFPRLVGVPTSAVCGVAVPLLAGGRALGVAGYTWDTAREFTDDQLAFLSVIAQQCAQALERAQQYDTSLHAARTLQRSLLPASVPDIDGMRIAARYQPVADGSVVGGDFYDVFRRSEDSWGIVIGDVSGKGVRAASLTALVRHTVRALGRRTAATDEVLCELNDAILAEDLDDRFATVIYLNATPGPSGVALRLTIGGHPQPVLRTREGAVRVVGTPGSAIGLLPHPELTIDEVLLAPGDMIVMFTDGFIEGRSPGGAFADDLVADAISNSSANSADQLADELTELLLDFQQGRPRDDMAILVLEATDVAQDQASPPYASPVTS
ncbi:MAG: GAF domain-containing SpoIIE family protein phosphatase, partial [Mycobacteriales bacterium]